MRLVPRFIANLPVPVKVVGGASLGYIAYHGLMGTSYTLPVVGLVSPSKTVGVITGLGAAALLGSAAADTGMLGSEMRGMMGGGATRNPYHPADANGTEVWDGHHAVEEAIRDGLEMPSKALLAVRDARHLGLDVRVERFHGKGWRVSTSRDPARAEGVHAELVDNGFSEERYGDPDGMEWYSQFDRPNQ